MDNTIVIGLPVFNEEAALPKLLRKLSGLNEGCRSQNPIQVVIVNDGSTDGTAGIIADYHDARLAITCITHPRNLGLGEAIKSMFDYVDKHYRPQDVLITLDADNTHDPGIIPDMLGMLQDQCLDVVIASRFVQGGQEIGLTLARKMYSRSAALFFNVFFPIFNVHDYSSGFRCYRVGYLQEALHKYNGGLVTSSGFECMAEILARFSKIGVKAGEYPLVLQYDLKEGKSKMKIMKTILGYVRLLTKVRAAHD